MLASTMILELVPKHRPADIAFDLLPRLVGNMLGYRIHDYLFDIGTMENYQQAQTSWPGLKPVSED